MNNDNFILEFEYRDADNYKTFFKVSVEGRNYPQLETLKVGDQVIMGQLGTPKEDDFFSSEIHPYPYKTETDHNILEVLTIQNANVTVTKMP